MNNQKRDSQLSKLYIAQQALSFFLVPMLALVWLFAACPQSLAAQEQPGPLQAPSGPPYQEQTVEQLQELVAPIALYPDSLVAQVLAASTFPEQVVDADQWVQSHPDLKGDALGQAVDQLPWDPSVKALVAFPSVLGNMDKNLSWTSSLGDAYYNQEQGVMDAIQVMRSHAQEAGHLNSTPQQTVVTDDSDIEIEPVSPEIIYVPAYDPWVVYGGPIVAWPGWYPYPGIWYGGPSPFFGVGFGIGFFGGYGWGGITGVAIGITTTRCTTTVGITRKAGRFITATDSIEANTPAVIIITLKEPHSPQAVTANAHRVITTVPKERHSLSGATTGPLEATPSLAVRAEFGRAPSAGTVMAERNGVFRRVEAPASAAEAAFTAAAGATEFTQV